MSEMQDWNRKVVDEFRATGRSEMFGDGLVVLHTVGAKTGEARENPVAGIRQPDGSWLVAASYAGRDIHPGWYHNLVAQPRIAVETSEVHDGVGVPVVASELTGADRDEGYEQFTRMSDGFRGYEQKTERVIPVIRLTPVDAA